jgi:hypothetical protein
LEDAFKAVNMSKIRSGGTETLTFPVKTTYRLIYSPNPSVSAESPPRIHDGFTALIDTFVDYKYTFEYIPHTPPIPPEKRVNGNAIDKIANFGDINESIYPKVWPEVVKAM